MALAARGQGPFEIKVKQIQAIYKWQGADFPALAASAPKPAAALPTQPDSAQPATLSPKPAPSIASLIESDELRERRMHDTSYFRGE